MRSLNNIQLCTNNLKSIKGGLENFANNINLKTINLDRNKLTSLFGLFCSNFDSTKNPLQKLTTLKLAYNQIKEISGSDLNCMFNLRELHLQFNKIGFINFNSFAKLRNLQVLYINDNQFLPYPNMLNGLQNSLEHLSINFKRKIQFEKAIEMILLESQMHKLHTLELSSSVFEEVTINLEDFLFTSNELVDLLCYDCNINSIVFRYNHQNRIRSKYVHSYKTHICNDNFNRTINFDFNYNEAQDCQEVKVKKWTNNFLKPLISFIDVKNYYCKTFNIRGYQNVPWYSNHMKMAFNQTKTNSIHKRNLCSLIGYSRSNFVRHNGLLNHMIYYFVFCITKILFAT